MLLLSSALLAGYARLQGPSWLLGPVCLVPFLAALERTRALRTACLLGAAQAVGFALGALGWFPLAVQRYVGVSAWGAFALLALTAPLLQPQFLALALARTGLRRTGAGLAALGGALAYVGVEWAAPRLLDASLGYGLYPAEGLRQAADVAGVRGLTLALLLCNEALWALAHARAWRRALALAAPLGLAALYGTWRLGTLEQVARARDGGEPGLRVGLVQANLTRYAELAEAEGTYGAVRTVLDTHYALSRALLQAPAPPELLVWPETVYPTTFGSPRSEAGAELDAELRAFAHDTGVPLLFGTYAWEAGREYNAAVLLSAQEAAPAQGYRKVHPFPLSEYVPAWLDSPALRAWAPWLGTWSPGPGLQLLTLERPGRRTLRLAPLICFDAAEPGLAAEGARAGADLLVTLANDAWFAGGLGARQHLVVSAFRSIETRLPQVRATPSGVSAEIDPLGRIVREAEPERVQALGAQLRPGPLAPALAAAWGDWVGSAALLALGLLVATRLRLALTPGLSSEHPAQGTTSSAITPR
nr:MULTISPECIES: apolipoprotein N-acyltransferase [Myxococcaceae]